MDKHESPLGRDYEREVMMAVIAAIIDLRADSSGTGGVVDPRGATLGVADALALLAHNTGGYTTPKDRRELAEQCRNRIVTRMKQLSEQGVDWVQATPIRYSR